MFLTRMPQLFSSELQYSIYCTYIRLKIYEPKGEISTVFPTGENSFPLIVSPFPPWGKSFH